MPRTFRASREPPHIAAAVADVFLIIMCTMVVILSAGIFAVAIYILKRYAPADDAVIFVQIV